MLIVKLTIVAQENAPQTLWPTRGIAKCRVQVTIDSDYNDAFLRQRVPKTPNIYCRHLFFVLLDTPDAERTPRPLG